MEVGGHDEEVVLPVSYLLATGTLRYKGYSVMVHERSTLHAGPIWSRTCIFCHNTVPEMDRLLQGALAARRRPATRVSKSTGGSRATGALVLRSSTRRASRPAARDEIARLGGVAPHAGDDPRATARRAIDVVRAGFDGGALIEVGIGCEACHGGAREHTRDPRVLPSLAPVAPWLGIASPPPPPFAGPAAVGPRRERGQGRGGSTAPAAALPTRCSSPRYPFTWEGGRRDANAGGSHINSGEARDFLLGGCSGAMACTACHDPHGAEPAAKLRALATPAGNATCTACHSELAGWRAVEGALAPRSRRRGRIVRGVPHAPQEHGPRRNVDVLLITASGRRPRPGTRVLGDRPLECALCHADRTVGALTDAMERWWPVRYPRQRLIELYGSPSTRT